MHGRSCPCLLAMFALAIVFLIPAASSLSGQSDRARPAPEVSFPLSPPGAPLSPIQNPSPRPQPPRFPITLPGTIGLPQIVQAAGVIFSGTVTAIAQSAAIRTAGHSNAVTTISITFHVERAIRGVIPGDAFTISQWMGAWTGGQRYRIGDRALLFLYPRSRLDLTSCVGGPLGRFQIDPLGRITLSAQQVTAFRTDSMLHGRSLVSFQDFAAAVERAGGEQ